MPSSLWLISLPLFPVYHAPPAWHRAKCTLDGRHRGSASAPEAGPRRYVRSSKERKPARHRDANSLPPTAVIDLRQSPGPLSAGPSASPGSTDRVRLGEFPCTVKNLGSRAEEAHHVVPAFHDRQTIGSFAVTAAELNRDRTSRGLFRVDGIHRIDVVLVRFQIALGVVADIDQKPATGTSLTVSLCTVAPSFRPGVIGR